MNGGFSQEQSLRAIGLFLTYQGTNGMISGDQVTVWLVADGRETHGSVSAVIARRWRERTAALRVKPDAA